MFEYIFGLLFTALIVAWIIWLGYRGKFKDIAFFQEDSSKLPIIFLAIFSFFILFILTKSGIDDLYSGERGHDTALHIQSMYSIRKEGQPIVSYETPYRYNWLCAHLNYWLYPMAWIIPEKYSEMGIFIFKNTILVLAVIPLYLLIRHFKVEPWPASLLSGAFLLYLPISFQLPMDFYIVNIVPFWAFFTLYFLLKERVFLTLFCLMATLLVQENLVLEMTMVGLVGLFFNRKSKLAMGVVAISFLYYFASMKIIDYYASHSLEGNRFDSILTLDYGYLGENKAEMAKNFFLKHDLVWKKLLQKGKLVQLFLYFAPLGFLSFIGPEFTVIGLPMAFLMFATSLSARCKVTSHYAATYAPFFYLGAILGLIRLSAFLEKRKKSPDFRVLVMAFFINCALFFFFFGPTFRFSRINRIELIREELAKIPRESGVCISHPLTPFVANREHINAFPHFFDNDIVVFDFMSLRDLFTLDLEDDLYQHFATDFIEKGYKPLSARDGFVIFAKEGDFFIDLHDIFSMSPDWQGGKGEGPFDFDDLGFRLDKFSLSVPSIIRGKAFMYKATFTKSQSSNRDITMLLDIKKDGKAWISQKHKLGYHLLDTSQWHENRPYTVGYSIITDIFFPTGIYEIFLTCDDGEEKQTHRVGDFRVKPRRAIF